MAVYIVNNMTIHDRAAYDTYLRAFMGVFRKFIESPVSMLL